MDFSNSDLPPPKITVFTVTTDPGHPGAVLLARTAKLWGWDLKWIIQKDGWDKSFRVQQIGQLEAIKQHPENDYFLYTDAWDTVFTGPPQELWGSFKPGVVTFSGDTVLAEAWKDYPLKARLAVDAFPKVGYGEFPYVNDGIVWGDAKKFATLAADYLTNYPVGLINQDYFNVKVAAELALYSKALQIDSRAQVALNLMGTQQRYVQSLPGGRIGYAPTGTRPVLLHYPGLGREGVEVLEWVIGDLHTCYKHAK